ncbi:MAG: tRNA(Met) cytidine acetate ligase [Anaeroplasmataceae bacterium]
MKVVGIIVEYNPLHNGHVYHLNKVKELSEADLVVAIITGYTSMRGDIQLMSKFDRCKLALEIGVDLVIELPYIFSNNNANIFSYYSVKFLNNLNIDEIWIGSESNKIEPYYDYLKAINSKDYNLKLKEYLDLGNSYKTSSNLALKNLGYKELLSNDILGIFYLDAIIKLKSKIKLNLIKRINNNYNDKQLTNKISSATAIRNNLNSIKEQVPSNTYNLYLKKGFNDENNILNYLKYKVILNNLENIFLVDEGIENSFKNALNASSIKEFVDLVTSKRYTSSKIKRIISNILFDVKQSDFNKAKNEDLNFVRVLGFNSLGKSYLSSIKKDIKIYTNIKNNINSIFDIEIKVSKIIDLMYNQNNFNTEQKGPIII